MKLRTLLLSLVLGGCCAESSSGSSWSPSPLTSAPSNPSRPSPGVTITLTSKTDKPIGKGKYLKILVDSPRPLQSTTVTFKNTVTHEAANSFQYFNFLADDLGEGLGPLSVTAETIDGVRANQETSTFLVDLTPPKIELPRTAIRYPGDAIGFWVADAWMLGEAEVYVAGKRLQKQFPQQYPKTLGKSWDISWVSFPDTQILPGEYQAQYTARDAAGNTSTLSRTLRVDGQAPSVQWITPEPGIEISNTVELRAAASDNFDGPLRLEFFAGGTHLGSVPGPEGSILIDPLLFPPGPLTLSVIAYDEVENESEEASIEVLIAAP